MSDKNESKTVNTGGTGGKEQAQARDAEFDTTGNVKRKGQDPSPDDRSRGESSDAEAARPIDIER